MKHVYNASWYCLSQVSQQSDSPLRRLPRGMRRQISIIVGKMGGDISATKTALNMRQAQASLFSGAENVQQPSAGGSATQPRATASIEPTTHIGDGANPINATTNIEDGVEASNATAGIAGGVEPTANSADGVQPTNAIATIRDDVDPTTAAATTGGSGEVDADAPAASIGGGGADGGKGKGKKDSGEPSQKKSRKNAAQK